MKNITRIVLTTIFCLVGFLHPVLSLQPNVSPDHPDAATSLHNLATSIRPKAITSRSACLVQECNKPWSANFSLPKQQPLECKQRWSANFSLPNSNRWSANNAGVQTSVCTPGPRLSPAARGWDFGDADHLDESGDWLNRIPGGPNAFNRYTSPCSVLSVY